MSVQTEIDRIIGLVDDSHEAVKAKGGTTSTPYLLANLPEAIESIPEAAAPVLQQKTVTPTTSVQQVVPSSGYDGLSKVYVNAIPNNQGEVIKSLTVEDSIFPGSHFESGMSDVYYEYLEVSVAAEAKTVTPTEEEQLIEGTDGAFLAEVTVEPIPSNYEDVTDETTAYTTKLAALETAMNELNTELDGKAAGSGGATLETGTLTGTTTYAVVGSYYYYDLSEFENKLMVTLVSYSDIDLLTRENVSDVFTVSGTTGSTSPVVLDGNILKSTASSYTYYAV